MILRAHTRGTRFSMHIQSSSDITRTAQGTISGYAMRMNGHLTGAARTPAPFHLPIARRGVPNLPPSCHSATSASSHPPHASGGQRLPMVAPAPSKGARPTLPRNSVPRGEFRSALRSPVKQIVGKPLTYAAPTGKLAAI